MFSEISVLCNRQPTCVLWGVADQANDTIKVDSSRFDKDSRQHFLNDDKYGLVLVSRVLEDDVKEDVDKENVQQPPLEVAAFQAAMKERQEQEEARQRALEGSRVRRDEERRLERARRGLEAERLEVQRLAEERREQQRKQAEAETEEARRKAVENVQRMREVESRREQEADESRRLDNEVNARSLKATQDRKTLEDFLARRGYRGVNSKRTKMLKSKYPLHTAVKVNSVELIELLLDAKADPTCRSSADLTPAHLAMKLNTGHGSHDEAICALQKIRAP